MKKKTKIILASCLGFLLLLALLLSVPAVSIWRYAQVDETRRADVAIVLGAGIQGDTVSPVFRERINHGIWLYENGYVDYLLLTGGVGDGNNRSDASVARDYAISQGMSPAIILIEETSTITEENLENARKIMEANGLSTALLVSDPLHMKRAMLVAEDYGVTAYSSPTPTTMYQSMGTKLPFLAREVFFYIGYCIVRPFR